MLQQLRDSAKSWVVKLLLGLLVLSFAAWGINDVFFSGFYSQNLATVGSTVITGPQYQEGLNRAIDTFSRQAGSRISMDDARRLGIDRQVRDSLLSGAALDSLASDLGVSFGSSQIAAETAANPMFHDSTGTFDPEAFRRLLANNGVSETEYVEGERSNRIRLAVTAAAATQHVPRTILDAQKLFADERRQAQYISVTVTDADVPAPTDAQLKEYFEARATIYVDPEYRSIAVMKVEPQDVAAKIAVSDAELQAGYEKYKSDYFTPERRTILQLSFPDEASAAKAKARLTAGEDFMKLATELGAKESDVTLPDKTKDDIFDPAVADAAFALSLNAVSEPVKGGLGTVLVKAAAITPEKQQSLAEVQTVLKNRLQLEKARNEIQEVQAQVEDARAAQTKFEEIAERAGIPFLLFPAVSESGVDRSGQPVQIPASQEVVKAAFASDVGVENDLISLQDGYVWYEVREIIPSAPQKLESVKDKIVGDWRAAELRVAADKKAKAMVDRIKAGTNLTALAAESRVQVKETNLIRRNEALEDFDQQAVGALFALPDKGASYALAGDGRSAVVMELLKTEAPQQSELEAQQADALRDGVSRDLTESFVSAVRSGTEVSINEELWRRISEPAN